MDYIREYSELFNTYYELEDTVRIINTKQSGLYIKNGGRPVDIFWSRDSLVFVFNRNETRDLYDKWCKRELK